ncbi:MAG: peptidoglycan DD-metalloendopeptidase family protein [Gammaproteobacteria bacterium]|nr:peptidoglycan DD-metalloendopeptidase family protein [Gammaproteobacteria bacterium]
MSLRAATKTLYLIATLMLALQLAGCGGGRGAAPVKSYDYYQKPKGKIHTVNLGDTLYSIAWVYGVDYRDLATHNGISEPFTIFPGQRLSLDLNAKRSSAEVSSASLGAPTRSLVTEPERQTIAQSPAPAAKQSPPVPVSTAKRSGSTPARKPDVATRGTKIKQWMWPAKGQIVTDFASSGRKGVDISGRLGQPISAAAEGRVVYAGAGLRGYGELIIVKHNKRYLSAYAHNNRILVKEGDEVKIGQRIAEMGSTGTDGVKLHFEIRRDGKPVDPVRYLPK